MSLFIKLNDLVKIVSIRHYKGMQFSLLSHTYPNYHKNGHSDKKNGHTRFSELKLHKSSCQMGYIGYQFWPY